MKNGTGFSRGFRAALLFLLGLTLGLLSAFGALHHPWIAYTDCLEDPEACDGRLVVGFGQSMIGAIREDGFELLMRGLKPVFVRADTAGLKTGEYIGIRAVYHKEGYLTATKLKVARRRREKIGFSLVPAVLMIFLFSRAFRFNRGRWEFEARSDA